MKKITKNIHAHPARKGYRQTMKRYPIKKK